MKNMKKLGWFGKGLVSVALLVGGSGCTGINPQGVTTLMQMGLYQTRTNVIRDNSQQIMTSEIWNLDTGKKEIEIVGWDNQIPYIKGKANNFPKKGFLVYNQRDNKSVSKGYIVTLEDRELEVTRMK